MKKAAILLPIILFLLWPGGAVAETSAKITGKWAHPRAELPVRAKPSPEARIKKRLQMLTEDGFPEVYAVYRQREVKGSLWYWIGTPGRPNGQRGWVRARALGTIRSSHKELRVNRDSFTAKLWHYRPGGVRQLIWRSRIGVGAPGTPTPRGRFWIRERLNGFALGTIYGPVAFGTAAYSVLSDWPGGGVVGIHGTNEPQLLPGAVSHGCIRVPNKKIRRLARLMPVGTPLVIR